MSTCALVAASDFNADHFKMLDEAGAFSWVVAVDGGFAHLESIGRAPDLAIGDFDSLGYVPKAKRVSRHPVEKDKSDLELAFDRAMMRRFEEIVVYGRAWRAARPYACEPADLREVLRTRRVRYGDRRHLRGAAAHRPRRARPAAARCGHRVGVRRERSGRPASSSADSNGRSTTRRSRTARRAGSPNEFIGEDAAVGVEEGTLYIIVPLT